MSGVSVGLRPPASTRGRVHPMNRYDDHDSVARTRRWLGLVRVALGALVSLLTALRLLGVL